MEKKRKWSWSLTFLVLLFGYGYLSHLSDKKKLTACSKETMAFVYKLNKGKKKSAAYRFKVDGEMYKGFTTISTKKASIDVIHGDSILIRYYCKDPSVNEYIGDE